MGPVYDVGRDLDTAGMTPRSAAPGPESAILNNAFMRYINGRVTKEYVGTCYGQEFHRVTG
jgi:hypothetical protein